MFSFLKNCGKEFEILWKAKIRRECFFTARCNPHDKKENQLERAQSLPWYIN